MHIVWWKRLPIFQVRVDMSCSLGEVFNSTPNLSSNVIDAVKKSQEAPPSYGIGTFYIKVGFFMSSYLINDVCV